jgi:hypothetical protein
LISGLIVGPDKKVWGVADGELFVFDVAARKVVSTTRLVPKSSGGPRVGWRDAPVHGRHPDGNVYATVSGRLIRIDPKTMTPTELRKTRPGLLRWTAGPRVLPRPHEPLALHAVTDPAHAEPSSAASEGHGSQEPRPSRAANHAAARSLVVQLHGQHGGRSRGRRSRQVCPRVRRLKLPRAVHVRPHLRSARR